MVIIKTKGYEIDSIKIKNSHNRRALRFKNNIINNLRAIGLTEDDISIKLEPIAIKRVLASASWYLDGNQLYYSSKKGTNYVENLYIVSKVIEFEIDAIVSGKKTLEQFSIDFTEDSDIEEQRTAAREFLGVEPNTINLEIINKNYKLLAKELHPDMSTGNTEKFKELNKAHKILKRELE